MRAFSRTRLLVLLAGAGLAIAVAALGLIHRRGIPQMFLAPMIGVLEPCIFAEAPAANPGSDKLAQKCTGPDGSAAALVDATLSALAPPAADARKYELGYTPPVPLLKLFKPSGTDSIGDTP